MDSERPGIWEDVLGESGIAGAGRIGDSGKHDCMIRSRRIWYCWASRSLPSFLVQRRENFELNKNGEHVMKKKKKKKRGRVQINDNSSTLHFRLIIVIL